MTQNSQEVLVDKFEAFICFIDIINSVSYGRLMDDSQYMTRVLNFENIIKKYFEFFFNEDKDIIKINRGDEFLIIIKNQEPRSKDSINFKVQTLEKLILFINITKFLLHKNERIEIAGGIHYGEVLSYNDGQENSIDNLNDQYNRTLCREENRYYGDQINYAKRVETSSREGAYLKIMLSYSCADILKYIPLVYDTLFIEMKGYSNKEIVYELKSGYVKHYTKDADRLIDELSKDQIFDDLNRMNNKLLKYSLFGLKLDTKYKHSDMDIFIDVFKKMIWDTPYTDDPIKLYFRGHESLYYKKYVLAFDYYYKAHKIIPHYTNIYCDMIKVLDNIIKDTQSNKMIEISSILYVKVLAEDCLTNFSTLFGDEKSQFESFIKNAEEYIKKRIG